LSSADTSLILRAFSYFSGFDVCAVRGCPLEREHAPEKPLDDPDIVLRLTLAAR
jgi:hypothetical protein